MSLPDRPAFSSREFIQSWLPHLPDQWEEGNSEGREQDGDAGIKLERCRKRNAVDNLVPLEEPFSTLGKSGKRRHLPLQEYQRRKHTEESQGKEATEGRARYEREAIGRPNPSQFSPPGFDQNAVGHTHIQVIGCSDRAGWDAESTSSRGHRLSLPVNIGQDKGQDKEQKEIAHDLFHRASAPSYEKRARHKTKADKYDCKKSPRPRNSRPDERRRGKRVRKKTGAALNDEFKAPNVAQDRLTLSHNGGLGIFQKGKISITGHGLPDLTFSDMAFLGQQGKDDREPQNQDPNRKKKHDKSHTKQLTDYFKDRSSTSTRALPHHDIKMPSQSNVIGPAEVSAQTNPVWPERRTGGTPAHSASFASLNPQPTPISTRDASSIPSSTYTWSISPSRHVAKPRSEVSRSVKESSRGQQHQFPPREDKRHQTKHRVNLETSPKLPSFRPSSSITRLGLGQSTSRKKPRQHDHIDHKQSVSCVPNELYTLSDLKNLARLDDLDAKGEVDCGLPSFDQYHSRAAVAGAGGRLKRELIHPHQRPQRHVHSQNTDHVKFLKDQYQWQSQAADLAENSGAPRHANVRHPHLRTEIARGSEFAGQHFHDEEHKVLPFTMCRPMTEQDGQTPSFERVHPHPSFAVSPMHFRSTVSPARPFIAPSPDFERHLPDGTQENLIERYSGPPLDGNIDGNPSPDDIFAVPTDPLQHLASDSDMDSFDRALCFQSEMALVDPESLYNEQDPTSYNNHSTPSFDNINHGASKQPPWPQDHTYHVPRESIQSETAPYRIHRAASITDGGDDVGLELGPDFWKRPVLY